MTKVDYHKSLAKKHPGLTPRQVDRLVALFRLTDGAQISAGYWANQNTAARLVETRQTPTERLEDAEALLALVKSHQSAMKSKPSEERLATIRILEAAVKRNTPPPQTQSPGPSTPPQRSQSPPGPSTPPQRPPVDRGRHPEELKRQWVELGGTKPYQSVVLGLYRVAGATGPLTDTSWISMQTYRGIIQGAGGSNANPSTQRVRASGLWMLLDLVRKKEGRDTPSEVQQAVSTLQRSAKLQETQRMATQVKDIKFDYALVDRVRTALMEAVRTLTRNQAGARMVINHLGMIALVGSRSLPPMRPEGLITLRLVKVSDGEEALEAEGPPEVRISPTRVGVRWLSSKTGKVHGSQTWLTDDPHVVLPLNEVLRVDPGRVWLTEDAKGGQQNRPSYDFSLWGGKAITLASLRNLFSTLPGKGAGQRKKEATFMSHSIAAHDGTYDQSQRAAQGAEVAIRMEGAIRARDEALKALEEAKEAIMKAFAFIGVP
jgi:hypothetical protein